MPFAISCRVMPFIFVPAVLSLTTTGCGRKLLAEGTAILRVRIGLTMDRKRIYSLRSRDLEPHSDLTSKLGVV